MAPNTNSRVASRRQAARNAEVANSGCVPLAGMGGSRGVAQASGSAAGDTGVASDVLNKAGYAAPHL